MVPPGLHGINLRVPIPVRPGIPDFKELAGGVDCDVLRDPEVPGLVDPVVNVALVRLNLVDEGDVIRFLQIVVEDHLLDVEERPIFGQIERQRNVVVKVREPDPAIGDLEPALVVAERAEMISPLNPGVGIFVAVLPEREERLEVVVQRFEVVCRTLGRPTGIGILLLQVGKSVRLLHIPDVCLSARFLFSW